MKCLILVDIQNLAPNDVTTWVAETKRADVTVVQSADMTTTD